jgi:F0F1-type ATP synthase membrane subunit b/b'
LAAIQATDHALQQQVNDIRQEMREQRREIVDSLTRVEQKLDDHASRR